MSASTLDVWGDMALGDSSESQANYQQAPLVPTSSAMSSGFGDFQFTSPSAMPPR